MDFLGLLAVAVLFVLLRKGLTRSLFSLLYRITKRANVVAVLYALFFFPGVVLHELSHWLIAKLLRVPTERISLIPEWTGEGTLRFGFVEMEKVDSIRSALIGLAPLVAGSAAILWLSFNRLNLGSAFEGDVQFSMQAVASIVGSLKNADQLWLWIYLLFAISNSMLPSPSDRQSWLRAGLIFLGLILILYLLGVAPQLAVVLGEPIHHMISAFTSAFFIAAALDLLLFPPVWLADRLLRRLGLRLTTG